MGRKPEFSTGYRSTHFELVRATCLYVATRLGDLMDEVVIVGGLVPSLLIDQANLPDDVPRHAGTADLDIGLALGLLNKGRYRTLAERLRDAGFLRDKNEGGKLTNQRWKIEGPEKVTMDFLIPPSRTSDTGGTLHNLEKDFAAVIAPGLDLAFKDRERVNIQGRTIRGESAEREVWVCGPGAYVVLKALAFENRGEEKDAYDLYYVLRNFGAGVEDVVQRLRLLLKSAQAKRALATLERDFGSADGIGPRRVARFLGNAAQGSATEVDVVSLVRQLLQACKARK